MSSSDQSDKPIVDRLIDVAGEIFARKGASATVREICSEAGCSVAAINYYFGDKQQLFLRCIQTACERKQKLFPLPSREDEPSGPIRLQMMIRLFANRMTASVNISWHNTLMLREVIAPSSGVAELLREPFQRDFALMLELIGDLLGGNDPQAAELNKPEMRQDLTTQIIARIMFLRSGLNLRIMLGLDNGSNEDPIRYADTVSESLLMQINALRISHQLPPLNWSATDNPPLDTQIPNDAASNPQSQGHSS